MAIGFCALALGVFLAAGEPVQVMTVGCIDGKADEFALAPDGWGKWGSSFGASVRFRAGTDVVPHVDRRGNTKLASAL